MNHVDDSSQMKGTFFTVPSVIVNLLDKKILEYKFHPNTII